MVGASGEYKSPIYSIYIGFPNIDKYFTDIKVVCSCTPEKLGGIMSDENIFDVIIGMDIIQKGDFSFRKENEKYIFEFVLH